MINYTNDSVKPSNENFYEVFLNIWTIKIITTLISFFENLVGDTCEFLAIN